MKKFIVLMLSVLLGVSYISPAYASSETSEKTMGYASYTYTDTGEGITINHIDTTNSSIAIPSTIDDKPVTRLDDKVCAYNESIKIVELPETITEIGREAFVECTNLKTINIPSSVTSIGARCFDLCSSLTEIYIPDNTETIGYYAFYGCTALKKANIPSKLTEIPDGMYACCSSLTSIKIPDSINKIGESAFSKCTSLSNIDWDLNADLIAPTAFDNTPWFTNNPAEFLLIKDGKILFAYNGTKKNVVIPSTVTEAAEGVFSDHTEIESVIIPDGMTGISDFMFAGCSSLKSIELPDSIEYIGVGGFGECSSLKEITIPDNVVNIKEKAFLSCTSLTKVHLPSNLEGLGRQAFAKCTALKTINIPSMICYSIERNTFLGAKLENVTIEGKMTNELSEALVTANWTNGGAEFVVIDGILTNYNGSGGNVVIPDDVTEIGANVFMNKEIKSITFPQSLTRIGQMAFYGVKGITEISIPGSVKNIGQMAFADCSNLKTITFEKGSDSIALGSAAFQSTAVTSDTLITNDRSVLNMNTAFYNTAIEDENEAKASPSPVPTIEPTQNPSTNPAANVLSVKSSANGITINADDKPINFADAQPFIDENGRTQISIRAVAEALGCTVEWDDKTQTATLSKDNKTIIIKIGDSNMQVGKEIITMDTTAQIINERTYIPVRFVGEALGMKVNWESK